ncbi:MAG: UPF0149 family protein [Thermodesulfobacteriota bacterium]
MKNLSKPLTEKEIERLDNFLLDRINDDADTEGKEEGVLDISTLDGFFTAIVSGPATVMPSQWLPAIWGDFEPVWEDQQEFENIFSLMVRHMNVISATLMESPEDFEPIFFERKAEGRTYTIVDEWCDGYWRGVGLAAEQWQAAFDQLVQLLMPIVAFTEYTNWQAHDLSHDEIDLLQKGIPGCVREIHAYWLARREESVPLAAPRPQRTARAGRNDPCPCGSGKKFKKCCLQ